MRRGFYKGKGSGKRAPVTAAFGSGRVREVSEIYAGSDGDATKALYDRLQAIGPVGVIALNVFRAQKCSERAKRYRGGEGGRSYASMAYERKDYSIRMLAETLRSLAVDATAAGITWGWAFDEARGGHPHLLYVDLPTGQVSWHGGARYVGPDYPGTWDGATGSAPERICRWVADLLDAAEKEAA